MSGVSVSVSIYGLGAADAVSDTLLLTPTLPHRTSDAEMRAIHRLKHQRFHPLQTTWESASDGAGAGSSSAIN